MKRWFIVIGRSLVLLATVQGKVCRGNCFCCQFSGSSDRIDEGSHFCAFFGGGGYSVDDVGYWCFDGMDGFTLVARKVCAGGTGSFDSGASGGSAVSD